MDSILRIPRFTLAGASLLALTLAASAPARADGDCPEPSSLSGSFQPKAMSGSLNAKIVITPSLSDGKVVVKQDTGKSWVNTNLVSLNGKRSDLSKKAVKACQTALKKKGNTFYRWKPNPNCPAAAANSSAKEANSQDDCESVIGAGIDADSEKDQDRLLQHERYHMKLACAIASQANDKIGSGTAAAKMLAAVKKAIAKNEGQYDRDTNHGCKGDKQSTWESKIDDSSARWIP